LAPKRKGFADFVQIRINRNDQQMAARAKVVVFVFSFYFLDVLVLN